MQPRAQQDADVHRPRAFCASIAGSLRSHQDVDAAMSTRSIRWPRSFLQHVEELGAVLVLAFGEKRPCTLRLSLGSARVRRGNVTDLVAAVDRLMGQNRGSVFSTRARCRDEKPIYHLIHSTSRSSGYQVLAQAGNTPLHGLPLKDSGGTKALTRLR